MKRAETDFFSGEPLASLSTLVYSNNIDLQRSASLTFAEITERGEDSLLITEGDDWLNWTLHRCADSRPRNARAYPLPPRKPRY